MRVSTIELVIWTAGFATNFLLLIVLMIRRSYRVQPWFSCWIAFGCANTAVLYWVSQRSDRPHLYFDIYWLGAAIDLVLQCIVLIELARSVLRREGKWVEEIGKQFWLAALTALVIAIALSARMHPATTSPVDELFARANLFMTVLFCFVFTSVMVFSHRCGLAWGNRAARVGYGLMFWTILSFLTDTLHTYWRTAPYFDCLENARSIFYLAVLTYWIFIHWAEVPSMDRQLPSPAFVSTQSIHPLENARHPVPTCGAE